MAVEWAFWLFSQLEVYGRTAGRRVAESWLEFPNDATPVEVR